MYGPVGEIDDIREDFYLLVSVCVKANFTGECRHMRRGFSGS